MKAIKKVVSVVMVGIMLVALTACGSGGKDKPVLVISTWGLEEDSLWSEVYAPFEEAFDCTIQLETGTTAERYTKLSSNPNSTIDVIELSQKAAADGYKEDLFEKIDYTKVPNYENLIPAAKKVADAGFGPAYTINSIGIVYDKEKVGFEIKDWSDLWDARLEGKISIPDLGTTFGPAVMYMASDYKNVDITTDNGDAAFKALAELKPNIVKTYAKSADLANMFAADEISVAIVGDFGFPTIKKASETVEYLVPASGTYANFNTIDIPKNAPNKELAYEYLNWRISKETQTKTLDKLNEAPVNKLVEITPEQSANKTVGEIADSAKTLDYTFVNEQISAWTDRWNKTLNQ